jgi:hypothetical protein
MPERASQFFSVMLGLRSNYFYIFDGIFKVKPKLGQEFVSVHFAPLRNDVYHRFWVEFLGV